MVRKVKYKAKSAKEELQVGEYIDLRTDFGFKRVFKIYVYRKSLLNAVLGIRITKCEELPSGDIGLSEDDRQVYFDLFCELSSGKKVIIEMQKHKQRYYIDRSLFYTSRIIQNQGMLAKEAILKKRARCKTTEDKEHIPDWNYELNEVYSVNICNFIIDHSTDDYLTKVQLLNVKTKEVFYDKMTLVYLELPKFKNEEQLDDLDSWMYIFNNLNKPDFDESKVNKNPLFADLLNLARYANLTEKEKTEYYESLKSSKSMSTFEYEMIEDVKVARKAAADAKREAKIEVAKAKKDAKKEVAVAKKEVAAAKRDAVAAKSTLSVARKKLIDAGLNPDDYFPHSDTDASSVSRNSKGQFVSQKKKRN
jgi:predicted transposase/invertase (TIGR01784 family)